MQSRNLRFLAVSPSLVVAGLLGLLVGLPACGPGEEARQAGGPEEPATAAPAEPAPAAAPAAAPSADAVAEARQIFATRCTTCHGAEGGGDGPGSVALDPKPRDFRDAAWQESVSDEHIHKIILYGGAAVGRSPAMPGNPDLTSKEPVVAALVEHVRSLRRN